MDRPLSIINLCLVFALALWYGGYPFLGELFEYKERSLLYQNVMGNDELGARYDKLDEVKYLHQNREHFEKLPLYIQEQIYRDYQKWQTRAERSGWKKFGDSLVILGFSIPSFLRAWLVFALIISIMALKGRPQVMKVLWVLPVVAFLYSYTNVTMGYSIPVSADHSLFPTEQALIEQFYEGPLSPEILIQQKELTTAWNRFLVRVWASEEPSENTEEYLQQIEKGKFYFSVARLLKLGEDNIPGYFFLFHQKQPLFVLTLFLVWNFIYSISISFRHVQNNRATLLRYSDS